MVKKHPEISKRKGGLCEIYTQSEIDERRKYIHNTMIDKYHVGGNFIRINKIDLEHLWSLYDKVFFGGQVGRKLTSSGSVLVFKTTLGGNARLDGQCETVRSPCKKHFYFTMSFPGKLYSELFTDNEKQLRINGITCWDRLSCLQMSLEHESIHMLMQLYGYDPHGISGPGKMIYSPHGKLFRSLTKMYFGHTNILHGLQSGDVSTQLTRADISVGLKVISVHQRKGQPPYIIRGTVTKILPVNIQVTENISSNKEMVWRIPVNLLQLVGGLKKPAA